MKHLSGSLSDNKEVPEENPDEVRYKEDENLGRVKETKTTTLCCICGKNMWVEDRGHHMYLNEGFKVVHKNAYKNGIPDYLKIPNILLECHYKECKKELEIQLFNNSFLERKKKQ